MLLLAASLFLTEPLPLDMPRASSFLMTRGESRRLEDRYSAFDLWVSESVDGRWMDEEGRVFVLAHLSSLPPLGDAAKAVKTRVDFAATRVPIKKRDLRAVRTAVGELSPVAITEKESRPRQLPRGFKDVDYWQGTNTSAIVCAYLLEKSDTWRFASWELAEGDDFGASLKLFEREFLAKEARALEFAAPALSPEEPPERARLRLDARHSVAMYPKWHVTDGEDFVVLDDLPTRDFAIAFTNDLKALRREFARVFPPEVDITNSLAVARIYSNRNEYLEALEASGLTDMGWSAAYWSPERRELVASGADLKTLRHEAFHQYLSYATAFREVEPYLNEGYAQYFEDPESLDWRLPNGKPSDEDLERLSFLLPALFKMNYEEFYAGSDEDRLLKYRLAWSFAVFLEKGKAKKRNLIGEWLAWWKSHG